MGYRDNQRTPRHSAPEIGRRTGTSSSSRPRREPLNDHYYYEEPPRSRGNDQFEDISSYSSPKRRREDQRALEQQRRSGRSSRKKMGAGKKVAIGLLVVLILVGAGFFYVFGYLLNGLTMTSITKDPEALGIQDGVLTDSSIKNIALFGLDAREDENVGRSDALMILTVDNKHDKLKLTSILRDSEVQIDGYGSDKITHAYAYGGPELAIEDFEPKLQPGHPGLCDGQLYRNGKDCRCFWRR